MDHAGKLQPPPLVAKRPERDHRVRVAGTQQAHGNPDTYLVLEPDTLGDISEVP